MTGRDPAPTSRAAAPPAAVLGGTDPLEAPRDKVWAGLSAFPAASRASQPSAHSLSLLEHPQHQSLVPGPRTQNTAKSTTRPNFNSANSPARSPDALPGQAEDSGLAGMGHEGQPTPPTQPGGWAVTSHRSAGGQAACPARPAPGMKPQKGGQLTSTVPGWPSRLLTPTSGPASAHSPPAASPPHRAVPGDFILSNAWSQAIPKSWAIPSPITLTSLAVPVREHTAQEGLLEAFHHLRGNTSKSKGQ